MNLPNAENARIDPAKIRDYLLSPPHPIGRFKSAFFTTLGYSREKWHRLESDLLELAATGDVLKGQQTEYGRKYAVRGTLKGPNGRAADVVSVWIVMADEEFPRLITAYPGGEE